MLYTFSLLFCLFIAIWYDILGQSKYKNTWYHILLFCFIAISALQFQVGTDIPHYMKEYKQFDVDNFKFSDLFEGGEDRRQPGWILLMYVCRFFTEEFVFFKIIQAMFLNIAVFSFFRRETKNVFLCIFLYALISYLVLNFNLLRQSFALGFTLYGYSYLRNKQIAKYLLCVFAAFMFHYSAFVLIFPLLVEFLKFNRITLWMTLSLIIIFIYFLSTVDIGILLADFFKSGYVNSNISSIGLGYMQSEDLGVRDEFSIFSIRRLCIAFVLIYFLFKSKDMPLAYMGFAYLAINILVSIFPIIWRFRIYFDISYLIILAAFIKDFEIPKLKCFSKWMSIVLICIISYFFLCDYLIPYEGSSMRYIDQYYPYHSVFDPIIEYKRLNYF